MEADTTFELVRDLTLAEEVTKGSRRGSLAAARLTGVVGVGMGAAREPGVRMRSCQTLDGAMTLGRLAGITEEAQIARSSGSTALASAASRSSDCFAAVPGACNDIVPGR